ncbi:hypothetical protein HYS50_02225 [Candidatus Woesearchaeota archaeon]|nr:hypothetical protein [Candidatus Woesearchaeota archaeon]
MVSNDLSGKVAISTVTLFRTSPADQIRARLALDSIAQASNLGYSVDMADGGSADEFLREAERRGAIVNALPGKTFGERTRYGVQRGYAAGRPVLMRLEIEKTPLISQIQTFASPLFTGDADFVVPHRGGSTEDLFHLGYPIAQACAEKFGDRWFKDLTGIPFELDMWGGTRAWRRELSPYFLDATIDTEYPGADGKPNNWACYFVPVARILRDAPSKGLKIKSVPITFHYPPEQAAIECADPAFTEKRRVQLELITRALYKEWSKTHTPFTSIGVAYQ